MSFKDRNSDLRALLKIFKSRFDDLSTLTTYEPALRRLVLLQANPRDRSWRSEGLHQLALYYQRSKMPDKAREYYQYSLREFEDHERLGLARTMRDYGLFVAQYYDPHSGHAWTTQALALHDDDLEMSQSARHRAKGLRQRRITETYVNRTRLLLSPNDSEAVDALVAFATDTGRDCSLRDQQQVIVFTLKFASGIQKQLLTARLLEINARRRRIKSSILPMAKFVIGTGVVTVGKLGSVIRRKG